MSKIGHWLKRIISIESVVSALFIYWANVQLFSSRPDSFNIGVFIITSFALLRYANRIGITHLIIIIISVAITVLSMLVPAGEYIDKEILYVFLFAGSVGVLLSAIVTKPQYAIFWQLMASAPIAIKSFMSYEQMAGMGGYMATSYHLFSVFVCLILIFVFKKQNIFLLAIIFLIAALILFIGTRGAIVAMVLSVFISYLIKAHNENLIRRASILLVLIIIILTLYDGYIIIFTEYLNDIFASNSRFLYLLYNDEIFVSEGRKQIYLTVIKSFINGNLLGNGIGAVPYLTNGNSYSHNFIIELIADFGIFAILIIYGLYRLLYESVWENTNKNLVISGLLVSFLVLLPRIFSGTLLHSYTLPMVGMLFQIIRLNKNSTMYRE